MSKRQTQKMLQLMASGEPVELANPMASVKKLARLAFIAQQFGYEYAEVWQGGRNNSQLKMLIVPDPSPQARARAAQNWAQYPNAGDGESLPPLVPDAVELLKARINFDLTGKSAEKRMGYGALGVSIGCVILAYRLGSTSTDFVISGGIWLALMAVFAIGLVVNRKRNAKFAARLQAAGFTPVTDETGRVRHLPPGGQMPGHGNPFGGVPYGAPAPGYGQQPQPQGPGYGQQPQSGPGHHGQPPMPYGQPAPGPYAPPAYGAPPAPAPYGAPPAYGAQPQPQPQVQPQPQPQVQPQQNIQQNPHWQPPQR